MKPDEPIAVTGATGGVGGRVARRLADTGSATGAGSSAGAAIRLLVRDPDRAPSLPGAQVARADYYQPETVRAALAGVTTLFLVSASEDIDRVSLHRGVVDAAVDAGVTRIVYTSFLAATPEATFTFARDHWHTEQHIRASGVAYTFLRDSLYQDVLPYFPGPDGVIRGPAGEGRFAPVARDDVADVATAALLGSGHDGRTYDLTGPATLTMAEVAAELSRVTGGATGPGSSAGRATGPGSSAGATIRYHAETMDEAYASRAHFGASEWELAGWVTSYAAIATGELDQVSPAVAEVTGRPPTSFAEFLAANPDLVASLRDRF